MLPVRREGIQVGGTNRTLIMDTHFIVGKGNRCLCGIYQGEPIHCSDVSKAWSELEAFTVVEENPSMYIPKGGRGPIFPVKAAKTLLAVIESLKQS